jgi:UDP-2,3-diacylglucosamine hydrolase
MQIQLNEKSTYINIGDWIRHNTYAVFDGEELRMEVWEG